jgi:hypothetical protein
LSNYDDLLEEARVKAEAFRSSAKKYIPKMYKALRAENRDISPEDARDRIEKDCVNIWARRTILDALPEEAKNQEKRKAGRLSRKEHNSAAFSAAPLHQEEQKKIIVDTYGKPIEESLISSADASPSVNSSLLIEDRIPPSPSLPTTDPVDKREEAASDTIDFEFPLLLGDIRPYMAPLYKKIGDTGEVWFAGKLDIRTRKVIEAHLGRKRIEEQFG